MLWCLHVQAKEKDVKIIDEDGLMSLIKAAPNTLAAEPDLAPAPAQAALPTAAQLMTGGAPAAAAGAPKGQERHRSMPAGLAGRGGAGSSSAPAQAGAHAESVARGHTWRVSLRGPVEMLFNHLV